MSNIVPEKIQNFSVYINGSDEVGIAEGNFPNIEAMTSEVKGAGIAGVADTIVLGHFNSITCSLKWRVTPSNFYELSEHRFHNLDLYAGLQYVDAGQGILRTVPLHIFFRAETKSSNIGNMTVGESMESETEHEIVYMKIYLDGAEKVEIDKFNYIYKVNGYDYLSDLRRALGKM